ncbi:MAG: Integral membrane protein MviN [Parcubacteria group bacterium Gr01-1014_72]|nr:MAG: Integral membrane protein MviN [Parcubacteria group bacterium Gr01-1014_72]
MVTRVLRLFEKEFSGLHEAAYLLALFALLSQTLAFFRDRLFAGYFGAGETLDLYYAAFRIPDFIFVTASSIVSVSILIPFLIERLTVSREATRRFIDTVFSGFSIGIVAVGALAYAFAPALVRIFFPGFADGALSESVVELTRIMLLQPIFLGISNLFGSITQARRRFFVYALAPLLYNAGIIGGILFLYPVFGLRGLAFGVVAGALFHLLVQVPIVARAGLLPRFTRIFEPGVLKSVSLVSLPRTLALSANNLTLLLLISFSSIVGAGAISVFTLSWNLQSVPLTIIGASYALAAFPTLVRLFAEGDRAAFGGKVADSIRHIVFWSSPALALFIVLRAQIVRTVFGVGAFDWTDTRLTAASLALFAVSVVAQSVLLLFVRAFYAFGNTKVPLLVNVGASVVTLLSAALFLKIFSAYPPVAFFVESLLKVAHLEGTAVLMLPLAYSFGTILNAGVLWRLFERSFGSFPRSVYRSLYQSFAAAVIMGFASYIFLNVFDDVFALDTLPGIFFQGLLSGLLGIVLGVVVLVLLGNREVREVWETLHHRIWKAKIVGPDPAENQTI